MNEQQGNHQQLIQELRALTSAINRQAETNQSLCDLLVKIISDESDGIEITDLSSETVTYLSGKPRG